MAAKGPQSGTSNGNAPPFATKDGRPTNVTPGRPTDMTASNGTPNPAAEGGAHDFLADPTGTPGAGPKPRDLIASGNRPQTPGAPEQRANPQSVPATGTSIPVDAGAVRRGGTGSLGNNARPFKGMK